MLINFWKGNFITEVIINKLIFFVTDSQGLKYFIQVNELIDVSQDALFYTMVVLIEC